MNNPKTRQMWIYDLLKINPTSTFTIVFGKYAETYGKSEKTFEKDWKIATSEFKAYQKKANKAKEDKSISEELKGVESGVKIKIQRVLELQIQVESLELELENNKMIVHSFSDGSIVTGTREMNSLEKASLHKTIKEIRAEISKIEGDYAPIKNDMNLKGFSPKKIIFK